MAVGVALIGMTTNTRRITKQIRENLSTIIERELGIVVFMRNNTVIGIITQLALCVEKLVTEKSYLWREEERRYLFERIN